jgi:hypothetical protein
MLRRQPRRRCAASLAFQKNNCAVGLCTRAPPPHRLRRDPPKKKNRIAEADAKGQPNSGILCLAPPVPSLYRSPRPRPRFFLRMRCVVSACALEPGR